MHDEIMKDLYLVAASIELSKKIDRISSRLIESMKTLTFNDDDSIDEEVRVAEFNQRVAECEVVCREEIPRLDSLRKDIEIFEKSDTLGLAEGHRKQLDLTIKLIADFFEIRNRHNV